MAVKNVEVEPSSETEQIYGLSVLLPCLNESETLETCVAKAQRCMKDLGIDGEVIVADNGSTDGSQEIARRLGAHVVDVPAKGYGTALMGGIAAARSEFVVMADAESTVETLRASWEEQCATALHGFFELFTGPRISKDTLLKWVEKFKDRKF